MQRKPTMQRRHYEMIAAVMLYARPEGSCGPAVETWMRAVNEFARQMKGTNDRFDVQRFLNACGV